MIKYNGFTISKLSQRGLYEVTNSENQIVVIMPRLKDCKKMIDKKVSA